MSSSSLSKTLYRYGRDPVSMTLLVCVIVSAVITFLSLAFLLGYIILQGIPNINLDLFAFEYITFSVLYSKANKSKLMFGIPCKIM